MEEYHTRPNLVCCGKTFKNFEHYRYHRKYACESEEADLIDPESDGDD